MYLILNMYFMLIYIIKDKIDGIIKMVPER